MKKLIFSIFSLSLLITSTGVYASSCEEAAYYYKQGKYSLVKSLVQADAHKGVACAEYYMGLLYMRGKAVKRDKKKGLSYIRRASEKGDRNAIDFIKYAH